MQDHSNDSNNACHREPELEIHEIRNETNEKHDIGGQRSTEHTGNFQVI
jgi:hypothetical protein